jgi:hypothetical protein
MRQYVIAFVAIFALGLYVSAVLFAWNIAQCIQTTGCTKYTEASYHAGWLFVLNTIGTLISASVVGVLAITPKGKSPTELVGGQPGSLEDKTLKVVLLIYVLGWLVAGVIATLIGVLRWPNVLKPLTDLGYSWLGVAVAALTAWFGVEPPPAPRD